LISPILSLGNVSKSYGALKVIDDLSFDVAGGTTLGILGPNGAGKTTLFNLISGDIRPDQGRVLFEGADIRHQPPHQRCREGIGRSYQVPHPFAGMTVFENLLVAATFGGGQSEEQACGPCVNILVRTGLRTRPTSAPAR
jgi:branched-chain amino acid transport system ATP-binding protein